MKPFEYLLLFAAVILGLAVSEIAINLNRLLKTKAALRWDVLAPLAALVAFLKIVTQWWYWHSAESVAGSVTFEMYLVVLVEAVLLFLLSATALPDQVPAEGLSLKDYFQSVRRRFWLLFLLQWLFSNAISIWVRITAGGVRLSLAMLWPSLIVLSVLAAAILVKNRWIQTLILVGFAVVYVGQFFGTTLAR